MIGMKQDIAHRDVVRGEVLYHLIMEETSGPPLAGSACRARLGWRKDVG